MTYSFVWVLSLKGPAPQVWDDDIIPIEKRSFIHKTVISDEETKLSLDDLAKKYPNVEPVTLIEKPSSEDFSDYF